MNLFHKTCYCLFYCRGKKNRSSLGTQASLLQSELPSPQAPASTPCRVFLHLPFSSVIILKRHSPAVLARSFHGLQKSRFGSTPSLYFLSFFPRVPLTLQHITWEITGPGGSPELAADLPAKVPLGSGMVSTCGLPVLC